MTPVLRTLCVVFPVQGVAVVLISHNMPEVLQVSDRVQVIRLGKRVTQFNKGEADVEMLVGAMTGALDGAIK